MTKTAEQNSGSTTILLIVYLLVTFSMIYAHGKIEPGFGRNALNPGLDSGELISDYLLPDGVMEAYVRSDGSMRIIATGSGFGGLVEFVVDVDASGNYSSIIMGANNETANVGGNVKNPEYLEKYYGHRDPNSIDALSGATNTSNALKEVLELCNQVFDSNH